MGRRNTAIVLAIVAVVAFLFLVPVIRFDTDTSPVCARGMLPCPLLIRTPITGHSVYWSITAYYLGIGTYLVTPSGFGFA
jgi:hypothetical protein